jgi:hypothetical protein
VYLSQAKDWDEFCSKHLHTTKETANRLIRYLDEFGPAYFEVAQFTRISPATYRAIAPSIRDQSLHHNGEAIALIPENAEKVAAAVAELRKTAAPPPAPAPEDPIVKLEKRCAEVVEEMETAVSTLRDRREQVRAALGFLRRRLERVELTL